MSSKAARTLLSRQRHFIKFLASVNLANNVALSGFSTLTRNAIMACFAATLASGQTILCKSIRADTINKYLSAAAALSRPFHEMNPLINIMGEKSQLVKDIIHETRRWESMPNRREPMTKDMVQYLIKTSASSTLPDGKQSVMTDWLVLGLQAGFRKMEWSQDATLLAQTNTYHRNLDGSSAAFVSSDFEFRGPNGIRMSHKKPLLLHNIETVHIKWRYQKNLDNGQTIPFAKDTICPDFCCVTAALRVWHRALKLNIDPTTPLAVFVEPKSSTPQFITNVHVTQLLKEAATAAHNITRKVDLARFTAHSIRVGACVLLHSQGATAELIKLRLRWRSDAFMFYLRNITALAEHHRDILRNV